MKWTSKTAQPPIAEIHVRREQMHEEEPNNARCNSLDDDPSVAEFFPRCEEQIFGPPREVFINICQKSCRQLNELKLP